MVNEVRPKVCVILGAGASHDVRNAGSPVLSSGFRPPLARDLFNLDQFPEFREILAEYDGAVVLAQDLAPRSSVPGFDLEKELRRIADHQDPMMREHYKHVPAYLRDLLMMCSYEYTRYPSCYIQLVEDILSEEPSDILFLVLNYDDLLEQALYRFTNGTVIFESQDDYVRGSYPVKVVKLHGSINWFKSIGSSSADWKVLVRSTDVLTMPSDGGFRVLSKNGRANGSRTYQIELDGNRAYPVLTAPLAGKSSSEMVCPPSHLATAREFLAECSRFLVIGSSGLDDDLLDLLQETVRPKNPWVQFVSGSEELGQKAWERFRSRVRAFRSVSSLDGEVVFDGGFEAYVARDGPSIFLRASHE